MMVFKSLPVQFYQKILMIIVMSLCACGAFAQQKLILIGGGPGRPSAALKQFGDWAGQERGRILIVTWATAVPEEVFQDLHDEFSEQFKGVIDVSLRVPQTRVERQLFKLQLASASGVFFSGGDQEKIMSAFTQEDGQDLLKAIEKAYHSGKVFGGTSAGTAVMSEFMITGSPKNGIVPLAKGLGFLPKSYIVDQHFSQRNRAKRLKQAQLQTSAAIAIGIDEDTALIVENRTSAWVVGEHTVRIFEKTNSSSLNETILVNRDAWEFPELPHRSIETYD
jgi:cyanophycinase